MHRPPPRRPLVIAHRGASGYLPEHTLEAKAMAYAMGADYLEQDVVATGDDALVVLHDIHLERVTDAAAHFPDRARSDGHWYVRDFGLTEVKRLRVTERRASPGGAARYPERFPAGKGSFRVPTLAEEIELVQGLNASTGRDVGIYPEIKRPAWHAGEGVVPGDLLLETLARHGYRHRRDRVWIQCFDPAELKRLRADCASELRQVQLLADDPSAESRADYGYLRSTAGLADVAAWAEAVGPAIHHVWQGDRGRPALVRDARAAGLAVHPYTLRADDLPPGFDSFETALDWFALTALVDGVFTDFPDRAVARFDALALPPAHD